MSAYVSGCSAAKRASCTCKHENFKVIQPVMAFPALRQPAQCLQDPGALAWWCAPGPGGGTHLCCWVQGSCCPDQVAGPLPATPHRPASQKSTTYLQPVPTAACVQGTQGCSLPEWCTRCQNVCTSTCKTQCTIPESCMPAVKLGSKHLGVHVAAL
jgi:hypothetical protein